MYKHQNLKVNGSRFKVNTGDSMYGGLVDGETLRVDKKSDYMRAILNYKGV